ncbi:polyketide synthase [Apiospora hydei]|uniref:Polyketide synthase n=1 Tax=Apiospora hydei TaxID=1337664 RepID=A0ABR1W7B9_9PEZI
MISTEKITLGRELDDYGLNSLISVGLRSWIKRECGVDLALSVIVETESLRALVGGDSCRDVEVDH